MRSLSCAYSKGIFYFFKLTGLTPFSYGFKKLNNVSTSTQLYFASSKIGAIYNLLIVCTVISLYPLSLRISYGCKNFANRTEFELTIDSIQMGFSAFNSVSIIIIFCGCQNNAVRLANRILEFAEFLKYNYTKTYLENKQLSGLFFKTKKIFLLAKFTLLLLLIPTILTETKLSIVMYMIFLFMCNVVVNGCSVQFSMCLQMIRDFFRIINDIFLELITVSSDMTESIFNGLKSDKFRRLQRLHLMLHEITEDAMQLFSLPILITTFHAVVTLTIYAYYVIQPFVIGYHKLTKFQYTHCVFQVLQSVVLLGILTGCVTRVIQESKRINKIVAKWLTIANDCAVEKKLMNFSIYLINQNISFTVFNLFSLDNSLLISILGAIITYLVIVLQFQESD